MAVEESRSADAPEGGAPPPASGGSTGGGGGRRPRGRGGRFQGRPKVCLFCVEKGQRIDYKQADVLRRFISDTGKIRPRRQTGTCARHQRGLSVAIRRARYLALLPYAGSPSRG